MEYLIQQFLKQNNLSGQKGIDYNLQNDGQGVYIHKWNFEIPKPEFSKEEVILQEAKSSKLLQLKENRDNYNLRPIVSIQAEEIAISEDGQNIFTGNEVYFEFFVNSTNQPASEPNSIVLGTILLSLQNPSHYIRYSCNIIEGQSKRKGYVALTGNVAVNLQTHIQNRVEGAILLTNQLETEINACTTLEEVNEINITF